MTQQEINKKRDQQSRDFMKLLHETVKEDPYFKDGVTVLEPHRGLCETVFTVQFNDGRTFIVKASNETSFPEADDAYMDLPRED